MRANIVALIHASGEPPVPPDLISPDQLFEDHGEGPPSHEDGSIPTRSSEAEVQEGAAVESSLPEEIQPPSSDPDLWLYRDRTVALLRRYLRLSIEVGRMPALLGREIFRSRVTSYKASSFEDSVIFVHDIERSLEQLDEFDQQLIARIVLQEYSKEEAGRILGCGYRTVERLFPEALDHVSEILLDRQILTGVPSTKPEVKKSCQEGKNDHFPPSD